MFRRRRDDSEVEELGRMVRDLGLAEESLRSWLIYTDITAFMDDVEEALRAAAERVRIARETAEETRLDLVREGHL